MGIVTEFGEIGIKRHAMVTEMQEFFCQDIELRFDKLDFFIDVSMLSAKMMSSILLECMDFSYYLELKQM